MLQNIFPAAGADSYEEGRGMAFSSLPEKDGETFHKLMALAQPPALTDSSPAAGPKMQPAGKHEIATSQSKNSKSGAQPSGEGRAKRSVDNSDAAATSSLPVNAEDVVAQVILPVDANAGRKAGLDAKHGQEVSGGNGNVSVVNFFTNSLPALPGAKDGSMPDAKLSAQAVSMKNPVVDAGVVVEGGSRGNEATGFPDPAKTGYVSSKTAAQTMESPAALPLTGETAASNPALPKNGAYFIQPAHISSGATQDFPVGPVPQAESIVDGTAVAEQDMPMNKTGKNDKTSAVSGKILPGAAVSVALENNLPVRDHASAQAMRVQIAATTASPSSTDSSGGGTLATTDAAASTGVAGVRSRALERTQELVVLNAMRLNSSSAEALQVVIRPDAGTQLSLELHQRGDGVEAQATLQRGDFEHLNQQWPALQQQLEQRGIRLAPLGGEAVASNSGGADHFQNNRSQGNEPDGLSAGSFTEASNAELMASTTASGGAHRGWESWA
jgi:hypothetical protein